jgi:hypothetical protein
MQFKNLLHFDSMLAGKVIKVVFSIGFFFQRFQAICILIIGAIKMFDLVTFVWL